MDISAEVEEAAKGCHICDTCIPIGKRKKPHSIRDGRFDTKELCCQTRRRETGCPVAVDIKMRTDQCDNCIRKQKRDCMYHGYPATAIPKSCSYKIGDAAVDTVYDVPTLIRKQGG